MARLQVRDGRIAVVAGAAPGVRSAWVYLDRGCLQTVEDKPQLAWRTLRVRGVVAGPLLAQAEAALAGELDGAIVRCWRSGLLRISDRPVEDGADLRLPSTDPDGAGGVLRAAVVQEALGRPVGAVRELRAGRPSRKLLTVLRRIERLG